MKAGRGRREEKKEGSKQALKEGRRGKGEQRKRE